MEVNEEKILREDVLSDIRLARSHLEGFAIKNNLGVTAGSSTKVKFCPDLCNMLDYLIRAEFELKRLIGDEKFE